jgi:hypothetical protein
MLHNQAGRGGTTVPLVKCLHYSERDEWERHVLHRRWLAEGSMNG